MPRFAVPPAPKCAKCATSVYHVEQAIGPMAKTYHKHCLTCTVCGKRLDSTLLVEHDGEPFCKNCHREHLGTGKGGFATAVKLNPVSPKAASPAFATPASPSSRSTARSPSPTKANARSPSPTKATAFSHGLEDDGVAAIAVRSRATPSSPISAAPAPASPAKTSSRPYFSRPTGQQPGTPIRSIDDAVSSRDPGIRDPVNKLVDSVGGLGIDDPAPSVTSESLDEPRELPSTSYYATPPPPSRSTAAGVGGGGGTTPSSSMAATPSRASYASPSSRSDVSASLASSSNDYTQPEVTVTTRRISAADTIGSVRLAGNAHVSSNRSPRVNSVSPLDAIGSLPAPRRPDPKTLNGAAGIAKVAPPRTSINPNTTQSPDRIGGGGLPSEGSDSSLNGGGGARAAKGGIERLGLGSIISDAGGGTPLCARCQRPVYFAEQKAAAGRKWHRGCLRCDGCSTTLDTGKLEEGPIEQTYRGSGANIWCRVCYAKYFGPKNLAVGFSLPDSLPR